MKIHIKKLLGTTNQWHLDVRVFKDDKELRKRETFLGTRAQAEERYSEWKKALKAGLSETTSLQSIETLGEAIDLYKLVKKNGVIPYKDLSRFNQLKNDLGEVLIRDLAKVFENYLIGLKKSPNKSTGKGLSNGSINKILVLVKCSVKMAFDRELILKNPLKGEPFKKLEVKARKNSLTKEQEERLLCVIGGNESISYLGPVVKFSLQIPSRKAELLGMKREDLDLPNKCIYVPGSRTKNGEDCYKPIPENMQEYFSNLPKETEHLFFRVEGGKYLPLGDFKKSWSKAKALAGIYNFRFHDTRRVSTSKMVRGKTPDQVLGLVANWKNPTYMIKTYLKLDPIKDLNLVSFG